MAPRRILSIWLAAFAIDRWRLTEGCARGQGADAQPLVLITETAHGPRIAATNNAARASGARIGTMLADARSRNDTNARLDMVIRCRNRTRAIHKKNASRLRA